MRFGIFEVLFMVLFWLGGLAIAGFVVGYFFRKGWDIAGGPSRRAGADEPAGPTGESS